MWWRKLKRWTACHLAILITLAWALWCAATAVAYLDTSPPQLQTVEKVLHVHIWVVWVIATITLVAGACIPAKNPGKLRDAAIWTRGIGMAITAGLLGMWAIEFIISDTDRGWVSGKNYALATFAALHHGWIISKYSMREG